MNMLNSTQLLLLGLLVWFAMSNKSKDTRNVILVVTGILFFCMMNVKEGFALREVGTGDDPNVREVSGYDSGNIFHFRPTESNNFLRSEESSSSLVTLQIPWEQTPSPDITCVLSDGRQGIVGWAVGVGSPVEADDRAAGPGSAAEVIDTLFTCTAPATCDNTNPARSPPVAVSNDDCGPGFTAIPGSNNACAGTTCAPRSVDADRRACCTATGPTATCDNANPARSPPVAVSDDDCGPDFTATPGSNNACAGTTCSPQSVDADRLACCTATDRPLTCPAGTYLPEAPATECIDCAAGTFKAGTGTGPCTACTDGKTSPSKSVSASDCTRSPCPAGKYLKGSACENCEKNTHKAVPGDGKALCIACAADQKSVAGATSCEPVCDAGESCQGPFWFFDGLGGLLSPCRTDIFDYCQK